MMYGRLIDWIDNGVDKFADQLPEPHCDFVSAFNDLLNVLIKRDPVIVGRSLS
jgi:hypothetical protein